MSDSFDDRRLDALRRSHEEQLRLKEVQDAIFFQRLNAVGSEALLFRDDFWLDFVDEVVIWLFVELSGIVGREICEAIVHADVEILYGLTFQGREADPEAAEGIFLKANEERRELYGQVNPILKDARIHLSRASETDFRCGLAAAIHGIRKFRCVEHVSRKLHLELIAAAFKFNFCMKSIWLGISCDTIPEFVPSLAELWRVLREINKQYDDARARCSDF